MKLFKCITLILVIITIPLDVFANEKLTAVVNSVKPYVVKVGTFDQNKKYIGQGTGFFVGNQGHLITNYHVIEKAYDAVIKTFDDKIYLVESVVSADKKNDLIELKLNLRGRKVKGLKIIDKDPLLAEDVFVIGCPQGLDQTVSKGIISAIRKNIYGIDKLYQMTAPISPGSSGSPVLNLHGEVVGVATLNRAGGQNLNFAVPAQRILAMQEVKAYLYVSTIPKNSTIKILNIVPKFFQGITLKPGQYKVEVSSEGYEKVVQWITLARGKKEVTIELQKSPPTEKERLEAEKLRLQKQNEALKRELEKIKKKQDLANNPIPEKPKEKNTEINKEAAYSAKNTRSKYKKTNNPVAQDWLRKSQKAIQKKNWAEVIRTTTIAISLDPGLEESYMNRAWAYCEKGFYMKSINDCNIAILLSPWDSAPYITRSWAYIEKQQYNEAIESCNEAIEIDPKNGVAYNNLGLAYHRQNKLKEAKKNYKQSCKFGFSIGCSNFQLLTGYHPNDIAGRIELNMKTIQSMFQEKKWDQIIPLASEVIELDSSNHLIYAILGGVYANKGLYKKALENCNLSISLNPDFGLAYNNKGYVLELMGDKQEAALNYEISCNLEDPYGCLNMERVNK